MSEELNIVVKMKFGAHLYGTASPESDADYRGVFLPEKEQVLLGRVPKSISVSTGSDRSRNTAGDVDQDYYSLHYFIHLACEGQTVALDMLHAPPDMILQTSPVWDTIVENRKRFYTKNLKSFVEYARRQAAKYGIKGSRLSAARQVLDVLRAQDPELRLRDVWEILPCSEHCYGGGTDPNAMREYHVCGKIFQESSRIHYVIPIVEKFYETYGSRAQLAAENRDIDWKALSHAFRAAYQVKELLSKETITFPLAEAPFLRQIKEGTMDYLSEVAPALESLMDEVEALSRASQLPDRVDRDFWDRFLCDVLERELF